MPLTLDGTNGVSEVQAGAVESGDLASGAIGSGDLPAESVIQVVSSTNSSGQISVNTTTETLIFDASITPKSASSKILVLCSFNIYFNDEFNVETITKLKKGGTVLMRTRQQRSSNRAFKSALAEFNFLDSPATTSEITYGLFCENLNLSGGNPVYNRENNELTITLMEIAG